MLCSVSRSSIFQPFQFWLEWKKLTIKMFLILFYLFIYLNVCTMFNTKKKISICKYLTSEHLVVWDIYKCLVLLFIIQVNKCSPQIALELHRSSYKIRNIKELIEMISFQCETFLKLVLAACSYVMSSEHFVGLLFPIESLYSPLSLLWSL